MVIVVFCRLYGFFILTQNEKYSKTIHQRKCITSQNISINNQIMVNVCKTKYVNFDYRNLFFHTTPLHIMRIIVKNFRIHVTVK